MPGPKMEESTCFKETIKEFTNKCTIVGLSQIATRKSWILRLMWAMTAIGGLSIAVGQTWGVITEFCEHKVIMKSEWRSEGLQPLPAITICALQPLSGDLATETASDKYDEEKEWHPEHPTLQNKTKKYFSTFQAAVDWNGGMYEIDSMLSDYRGENDSIQGWNGLQLSFIKGDDEECFTFNSAINPKLWIRTPPYTGATFYVFRRPVQPSESINISFVMYMSAPGVAQIIDSGDGGAIALETGNSYIISLDWEEVTRIQDRGTLSGCVASEGRHQTGSVYYSHHKQYMYSIEACTKSLMQNISLHYCHCYIDTIPISYFVNVYPDATPCRSTCAHVLNMSDIFKECGVPCWEMNFHTNTQQTPLLLFQEGIMKDMKALQEKLNISAEFAEDPQIDLEDIAYPEPSSSQDKNSAEEKSKSESSNIVENEQKSYFSHGQQYSDAIMQDRLVMVKVQVKSPMMSTFYETPKYSLSDFWGVVGGNLGLWLGVSAISIAELVELIIIVLDQLWKKCTRSEKVTPKQRQQRIKVIRVSRN